MREHFENGVIRWEQNVKNKKGHSVTGGLKMGVNVAAHTRHIFLGSAPPGTLKAIGPIVLYSMVYDILEEGSYILCKHDSAPALVENVLAAGCVLQIPGRFSHWHGMVNNIIICLLRCFFTKFVIGLLIEGFHWPKIQKLGLFWANLCVNKDLV